jgi:hypothetical protein
MKLFKWLFTHNLNYKRTLKKFEYNLKRLCYNSFGRGQEIIEWFAGRLGATTKKEAAIINSYVKYNLIPKLPFTANHSEFLIFI